MTRDPVKTILKALYNMALSRGSGIASIARAGGQDRVKINIRALFKYHDEELGYRLIEDAISELNEDDLERLRSKGIRLIKERGTLYIEVPVRILIDPEDLIDY